MLWRRKDAFDTVSYSDVFGFLSLTGYLAALGWVFLFAFRKSKNDIDLVDHGSDSFPNTIRSALLRSPDQGVITIADLNSEYRVLFRAYNSPNGGTGLEFGFPSTKWSQAHSPSLRDELLKQGISFREAREPYGDFVADIHVDCGRDIEKAVELARRCFFDLYGLALNSRFQISPTSWPDREDVVSANGDSDVSLREYTEVMGMPDPSLTMKATAYTAGLILFGYPALWWAWFLADERQPDWQWSLGSFHLAGSYATCVFLLIFGALYVGLKKAGGKIYKDANPIPKTRIRRIFSQISSLLIAYGLPLAVIASWMGI